MSYRYDGFEPYVPVAERRARAERIVENLQKKQTLSPVQSKKRSISHTFWGKAWCQHIESLSDYANRLPRGRTYVRHGLVCHLVISAGSVEAMVYGSSMYRIRLKIKPLPKKKWEALKQQSLGKIDSVLELLAGKLPKDVMEMVCDRDQGLFPLSKEIQLSCDCPDWARMCKHVAAVLYGVAVRLDESPEQLFLLRGVDYQELIDPAALIAETMQSTKTGQRRLDSAQLGDIFGVTLADEGDKEGLSAEKKRKKQKKQAPSKPVLSRESIKKTAKRTKTIRKTATMSRKTNRKVTAAFPKRLTGSRIYKKRREFGCSQEAFAQQVGVSTSTVSRWESLGRSVLTLHEATKAKLAAVW